MNQTDPFRSEPNRCAALYLSAYGTDTDADTSTGTRRRATVPHLFGPKNLGPCTWRGKIFVFSVRSPDSASSLLCLLWFTVENVGRGSWKRQRQPQNWQLQRAARILCSLRALEFVRRFVLLNDKWLFPPISWAFCLYIFFECSFPELHWFLIYLFDFDFFHSRSIFCIQIL